MQSKTAGFSFSSIKKTPTDRNVFSSEAIFALKKLFQPLKRRHSLLPYFLRFLTFQTVYINPYSIPKPILNSYRQLAISCCMLHHINVLGFPMTNGIPLSISSDSVNITTCVSYHWKVQISIYISGHCHDRVICYNYQNLSVSCFLLKIRNIVI